MKIEDPETFDFVWIHEDGDDLFVVSDLEYLGITLKSREDLLLMRQANLIAAAILQHLEKFIVPGITTEDINREVEKRIHLSEGTSAMLGYPVGGCPWPAVVCASVNEEVGHGIPKKQVLVEGDIVGIDLCIDYKGWKADTARTYPVGRVSDLATRLIETTRSALYAGIAKMVPGNSLADISRSVQDCAEAGGFSLVRDYTGHGIGRKIHEPPSLHNYFSSTNNKVQLVPGMVLALEPMVNAGTWKISHRGQTIVTKDGSLSAHFEHSVAITEDGPWILSEL
jgi:methionyl aminopeptidase